MRVDETVLASLLDSSVDLKHCVKFLENVCNGAPPHCAGELCGIGPQTVDWLLGLRICYTDAKPGAPLTAIDVAKLERPQTLSQLPSEERIGRDTYDPLFVSYYSRRALLDKDWGVLLVLSYTVVPFLLHGAAPGHAAVKNWLDVHAYEEAEDSWRRRAWAHWQAQYLRRARAIGVKDLRNSANKLRQNSSSKTSVLREFEQYSEYRSTHTDATLAEFRKWRAWKEAQSSADGLSFQGERRLILALDDLALRGVRTVGDLIAIGDEALATMLRADMVTVSEVRHAIYEYSQHVAQLAGATGPVKPARSKSLSDVVSFVREFHRTRFDDQT